MIIVTGGAGFIGSNIIRGLNNRGYEDILVVDNLKKGAKFHNLVDLQISDYVDKGDFLARITTGVKLGNVEAVFHQGACSDTTQWDGQYVMSNNYHYSKALLHYCLDNHIPLLYASSAAVYGNQRTSFIEQRCYERPLTVYGYSKFLFDNYVRQTLPHAQSPLCGLRYFNVYGPHEQHKGVMASVALQLHQQIIRGENPKLFEDSEAFQRDFIHIDDAVAMNLWCWQQRISGIFNCGSGQATSFQGVGNAVIAFHRHAAITYVPMPTELKRHYQTFTQANLEKIRQVGYDHLCKTVDQGIAEYLRWLTSQKNPENSKLV